MRTLRIISMISLAALWLALPASVSAAMPHSGRIAQTSVRVMNDSSEPIVVLLLDAQAQYPLGTVDGHTMQTLAVPPRPWASRMSDSSRPRSPTGTASSHVP